MSAIEAIGAICVTYVAYKVLTSKKTRSRLPYPPSPPADPVIGHARLLMGAFGSEPDTFYELGKQHGPFIYMTALGQSVAVINSLRIAEELLDKRGSIYCSRAEPHYADLMGVEQALAFMPYSEDFRRHRKIFQKYFRQDKALEHHPVQAREAHIMLQNIVKTSSAWSGHLLRYATAIIIEVGFGHTVVDSDDPYLKIADDFCQHVIPTLMTSDPIAAGLGPLFPILQHFPSWFPLTSYAHRARHVRQYVEPIYSYPLAEAQRRMAAGTAKPSFLVTQLEELQNGEIEAGIGFKHIKGAAAITYVAATDTTAASLQTIVAAMVLYPQYQEKIHAEIDRVIGFDRLPEFADRSSLPYLEHVIQEAARWQPAVPLQPHQSIQDDVYDGMFIPKGTLVIANTRGMTLDEEVYHDPFTFNPDRYLPKPEGRGEPHPTSTFGFGRRICPGRYLGSDNVWIAAAYLFATMNIGRPVDVDGKEFLPNIHFEFSGAMNHAKPFPCTIKPRGRRAQQLISDS